MQRRRKSRVGVRLAIGRKWKELKCCIAAKRRRTGEDEWRGGSKKFRHPFNPTSTDGLRLVLQQDLPSQMLRCRDVHYEGVLPRSSGNGEVLVQSPQVFFEFFRTAKDVRTLWKPGEIFGDRVRSTSHRCDSDRAQQDGNKQQHSRQSSSHHETYLSLIHI